MIKRFVTHFLMVFVAAVVVFLFFGLLAGGTIAFADGYPKTGSAAIFTAFVIYAFVATITQGEK